MAKIETLPPSLAKTLERCPETGERNLWLMQVASRARHVASPDRVRAFLLQIAAERGWSDRDFTREIDRAIARAYKTSPACHGVALEPRRKPVEGQPQKLNPFSPASWRIHKTHEPLFEPRPLPIDPAEILDILYPPDALLCLALDIRSAVTAPREHWRGKESALQFIVPNPMTAPTGLTQDGRVSARCLQNATRARTYQVVEFDRGTPEEQCGVLSSLHTEGSAPLVMVVWSGGKSMHGWFDVRRLTEAEKRDFFAWACSLGADPSLWDPSKLVRMPGGRRAQGHGQPVLDFQPHLLLD